jgi:hypothetical protein
MFSVGPARVGSALFVRKVSRFFQATLRLENVRTCRCVAAETEQQRDERDYLPGAAESAYMRAEHRDIAHALGVNTRPLPEVHDLVILGAGPAGLAAALYGSVRGAAHDGCRGLRHRRAGRDQLHDPQLAGIPPRHQWGRPRVPRVGANAAVRRRVRLHPSRDRTRVTETQPDTSSVNSR